MTNPEWIMAEAPAIKVRKEKERKDRRRDRKVAPAQGRDRRRDKPRRY
jgi:hypothetical protein